MKKVAIVLLILLGVYAYAHHKGWAERDAEMQQEIAAKNEEARQREQKLTEDLHTTATQLKDANDVVTQKQSALDRAISSGRVRLNSSCVQANASAPAPSGNSQAGSESDRQTLELIAQIAADGDRAIVQLNACIDAYNSVRSQVNDQSK